MKKTYTNYINYIFDELNLANHLDWPSVKINLGIALTVIIRSRYPEWLPQHVKSAWYRPVLHDELQEYALAEAFYFDILDIERKNRWTASKK